MEMKLQTGVLRVLTLVVLSVTHTRTVQTATPVSGVCPNHRVYDPISERVYTVPDTRVGLGYACPQLCLANGRPFVSLECLENTSFGAQWSLFEPNQACNYSGMLTTAATDTLKNLSSIALNSETLAAVLNDTATLIRDPYSLSALDVVYVTNIIQLSLDRTTVSAEDAETILKLVDTVVQVNDTILQESRRQGNATNRLILSLDRLGDKVAMSSNQSLRLVTQSTALEVWDLSRMSDNLVIGLEQRVDGGVRSRVVRSEQLFSLFENDALDFNKTDVAVVLPAEFLRNITEDTSLFLNASLESRMPLKSGSRSALNSKVVSARITVNARAITDLADYNVTTVFLPYQTLAGTRHVRHTRCVFWNFGNAGGLASWSDEGCTFQDNQQSRDVCKFNHLTNFAVLVDLYGQSELPEEHQTALSIITIVGLSLSIAGLSITIFAFIVIRQLRQGRHQRVLVNLAVSMLLSWVVFLAGFERVESHVGCLAVAALLHYLILASFLWMLMEGVLAYLLFVKVFGTPVSHYMVKASLFAWGLPLLPVIVVLAIDPELYRGGEKYCWMSLTPFYYAFLLPMALVMLANIVIYILVVVNICRRGGLAARANRSQASQRAVTVRASFACFVALGLSWVFAFFAIDGARVVFQYLFTITSSLQGFLLLLVFTARDPSVQGFFRSLTRSKLTSGSSSSDGSTSTTISTIRRP